MNIDNKVTIICVAYNQEKYIAQTLDSFINQKTNFPFVVLIGDDCSTDSTRKIIQDYAQKYPDIIKPILREKNIGAINNSLDLYARTNAEYATICEGDDYYLDENKLQKQVDFLESHPDFSICFHPVKVFYDDGSKPDEIFPTPEFRFNKTVLTIEDLLKHNFIQTSSVMYRWDFVDKTEIYPPNILPGDWFMHLKHAQKGKIGFLDGVMSTYRRHKGGLWWDSNSAETIDNLYLKYGIEMLNFHKLVYENFAIDKKLYFEFYVQPCAKNAFRVYLKDNQFEKLKCIAAICPNLIEDDNKLLKYNKKIQKLKKQRRIISVVLILTFCMWMFTIGLFIIK